MPPSVVRGTVPLALSGQSQPLPPRPSPLSPKGAVLALGMRGLLMRPRFLSPRDGRPRSSVRDTASRGSAATADIPTPEMVSPSAQLPIPEAGAPRRSGAPTCDAPGGSERNAGAWRPRVCLVRRRSGRGLALGLAARCLLAGASCGAGQRTFPGRSGECSQHASICSSRGLPATAAAAGAPTRTPGLEEGRSLRPWTLLDWSGARLMADPLDAADRAAVLQMHAARTRLLPCAHDASGLFFRNEVCDGFSLSKLFLL